MIMVMIHIHSTIEVTMIMISCLVQHVRIRTMIMVISYIHRVGIISMIIVSSPVLPTVAFLVHLRSQKIRATILQL